MKKEDKSKINVILSHKEESKKRTVEDFVDLFNSRYSFLSSIIQGHPEMKNAISIRRLKDKKEKEEVEIIVAVREKTKTKSGHIMLIVEDKSSKFNVLISKNRKEIYDFASSIMEDEVIGIKGTNAENIIFANQIRIYVPFNDDVNNKKVQNANLYQTAAVIISKYLGYGNDTKEISEFINSFAIMRLSHLKLTIDDANHATVSLEANH